MIGARRQQREATGGLAKSDLVVPKDLTGGVLVAANDAARAWCDEVNSAVHSEICAVPAERLEAERGLLRATTFATSILRPGGHWEGGPA